MVNAISSNSSILGVDIETTSLAPRHGKIRLIQINDEKDTYIVDCKAFDYEYARLAKLSAILSDPNRKLIIQNRKFEHSWFLYHMGFQTQTVFDTYLASILIDFRGKHGLDTLAKKYLVGVDMSKAEQASDWSGELSESQLNYAAEDVAYLHELRRVLLEKLQATSQLEAAKLEFDVVPSVASMESNGMPIDYDQYFALVERNKSIRDDKAKILLEFLQTRGGKRPIPKKIYQEDIFGTLLGVHSSNDINIDSWQQVLPIYQEVGVPITSTSEKYIAPLVGEYPEIGYLLDYRGYAKLASTYGDEFLKSIEGDTLYTGYNQFGTVTARFSGRKPNLLTIPKDKEYRSAFRVPEDQTFLTFDYSQMELRILAAYSRDSVMLDSYNTAKDLHSLTTANIFGLPYDEVVAKAKGEHKEKRDAGKILNFSVIYGISPTALMLRLQGAGIPATEDYCKTLIDGFYKTYKGAARWLYEREKQVLYDPTLRSVAGHLMKVDIDKNDKKSVNKAKRDARNYLIQCGNACATKRAMTGLYKDIVNKSLPMKIRNVVHDELNVTCDSSYTDEAQALVKYHMEEAGSFYFPAVKIEAEGHPGSSWADK